MISGSAISVICFTPQAKQGVQPASERHDHWRFAALRRQIGQPIERDCVCRKDQIVRVDKAMERLMTESDNTTALDLTTMIVASYVANNVVSAADLPGLIQSVQKALVGVDAPAVAPAAPQSPAVSVRRSVTPDQIICLEDGKAFKSLKRHLRTKYDLSPEQYRAKWGLPKDYPMVAPNYAAARSALAKSMGLGQGGRAPKAPPPAPAKRGRKPAAA